jgi:hypothetical protein
MYHTSNPWIHAIYHWVESQRFFLQLYVSIILAPPEPLFILEPDDVADQYWKDSYNNSDIAWNEVRPGKLH